VQQVSHLEPASDEQPLEQFTDQHVSQSRIQPSDPEHPQRTTGKTISPQISPRAPSPPNPLLEMTVDASSQPFHHRPQRALFVEIFAGTGNLSKHMYERGFDVICIDWKHNKHTSKFSAINIDLGSDDGQQVL